MELHPLLSRLEKTDLEQYMDACKADVMNFLEELGLSDTLALQVLEDVSFNILKNIIFAFMGLRAVKLFPEQTSTL